MISAIVNLALTIRSQGSPHASNVACIAMTQAFRMRWRAGARGEAVIDRLRRQQAWTDLLRIGGLVADGLWFMFPAVRAASFKMTRAVVVDLDGCRLVDIATDGAASGLSDVLGPDALVTALTELCAHNGEPMRIGLVLAERVALNFTLSMPYAPLEAVPAMVREALAAKSPFPPERTFMIFRHRSLDGGKLVIDAVIADRARVDAILTDLRAVGLAPEAFGVLESGADRLAWQSEPTREGHALPRIIHALAAPHRALLSKVKRLLALLVVITALTGAYNSMMLGSALGERREAEGQFRRIAQAASDAAMLAEHREATRRTARLLDELAGKLPTNAWLDSLKVSSADLELNIVAPVAADALRSVSAIQAFAGAQLRSPIAREANNGHERIRIGVSQGAANPQSRSLGSR